MWSPGQVVLRREVLNDGGVWLQAPVVVVRDEPGLLATYLAEGTPVRLPRRRLAVTGRPPSLARPRSLGGERPADAAASG